MDIEQISIENLRKMNIDEKHELCDDMRKQILNIISKNGGHLASNLGVVELTIALHSVFDTPKDKIIWDVGHQTYVHKMLTGRMSKMNLLRKHNRNSWFSKNF